MKRGRPFEPGNNFGRGRPKGSRNKTTREALALLYEYKDPLIRKCIAKALEGDVRALSLCIERILPALREPTVRLRMPKLENLKDTEVAIQRVLQNVGRGNITPQEAETIYGMVACLRDHIETGDLEARLATLETQHNEQTESQRNGR
jgi:hypothetical protein